MTARDFAFWFQGYLEIRKAHPAHVASGISQQEVAVIEKHLNMVFIHDIDPTMPDPDGKLQAAHDGKPTPAPFSVKPRPRC